MPLGASTNCRQEADESKELWCFQVAARARPGGRRHDAGVADVDGEHTGRCLCGAVGYTVSGPMRDVINCHCHRCRRWTGHHMAATSATVDDIAVTGEVSWYRPDEHAAYGFCAACGSSLFWQASDEPERWSICAGALDPPTQLVTAEAWWVSEASDYHVRPELPERATE
jgi:hypothetical protein